MCSERTRDYRALRSMTTQLNSKLITLNSNRKQKRTLLQKGFTLIELMVVTAIAGVLGAVAVPKFLQAREAAEAKAAIAEVVGAGRECQNYLAAGADASGMDQPKITISGAFDASGNAIETACESGQTYARTLSGTAKFPTTGISCLGTQNDSATSKVTVTASTASGLTCGFS